ncbi:deazaflavin-dependent oxidoreductase (nitroreductase family) [Nocardia tenerifensis]|uniref:Deazaflavin-dependent oxidoreductase (Nitroreductase family) n=1 Tax=Nocardia tenerifensis TaxID=228006 RepID=A0A318JUU6_9NOCA|nr:nitroreductase family deazaflavin-dependent oxidoreductase [Nocardia tenerifensis]PXX57458.1 deazaflavin-dependent oxidoreductase (nitroreductase family) [Nocardia tenerifensis]
MSDTNNLAVDAKSFNEQVIDEFRANAGKVGGMFEGAAMVLITTTGAKSGRRVTSPLVYLPDGDRIVLIASNGGSDKHPAWYHNLVADPKLTVEIGTEQYEARAEVVTGAERDALYARMVEIMPGFGEYQAKTSRVIPVLAVYRAA